MADCRSPNFVSLFSGCGGLDAGFHQAGFAGALSVDIEEIPLKVLHKNLASPTRQVDLSTEIPHLDSSINVDVLLAGSPCQGFSTAGLRRVDDPRNSLMLTAPMVAAKYRPKVVVAENVLGAVLGEHKSFWGQLHGRLRALGYQTYDLRVDSSHFGVAQTRKRIFLIAWRTGVTPIFRFDTQPSKVLGDVLLNLNGLPNHVPQSLVSTSNDFKIAARINQGQKLTNSRAGENAVHTWDIPEVFGRTNVRERSVLAQILRLRRQDRRRNFGDADPVSTKTLVSSFGADVIAKLVEKNYLRKLGRYHDLTNTFNGKYRRLEMDKPSRTVDTKFGDPRLFLHPIEHRGFTVREAARVQGFDDHFVFDGTATQQFRMIGNAVPPPLAKSVAVMVRNLL